MAQNDGSEQVELVQLNQMRIEKLKQDHDFLKHQLDDLGRQAQSGFTTARELSSILKTILDDDQCFFSDAITRTKALEAFERSEFFLRTGRTMKGE